MFYIIQMKKTELLIHLLRKSDVTVSVLRPYYTYGRLSYKGYSTSGVTYNNDGSVTVTELTHGSNIIKLTKGGHSVYQVIRAKKTAVEYAYTDSQGNAISKNELKAGCNVQITFGERNALMPHVKEYIYRQISLRAYTICSGTINITDRMEMSSGVNQTSIFLLILYQHRQLM